MRTLQSALSSEIRKLSQPHPTGFPVLPRTGLLGLSGTPQNACFLSDLIVLAGGR